MRKKAMALFVASFRLFIVNTLTYITVQGRGEILQESIRSITFLRRSHYIELYIKLHKTGALVLFLTNKDLR